MKYKNIFFDLDDTLWAFSENSQDTFKLLFHKYHFNNIFESFELYYSIYESKNLELWELYGRKEITKEDLNKERFSYPLREAGVYDTEIVRRFMDDYFVLIPKGSKLMPNAKEVLDYLKSKYNLYIISNGFSELQDSKMKSSGIDGYFKKIILSEDIGVLKPYPQIFHFALSATQSELKESVMIGDNFKTDITGAYGVGMDQVYYNLKENSETGFKPTYEIKDLIELKQMF